MWRKAFHDTVLGEVSHSEVRWPSHSSSLCHLRQGCLRLRQPERHPHRLVPLHSRGECGTSLLALAGYAKQRAEAAMAMRPEQAHAEVVGEHAGLLGGGDAGPPPGGSRRTVIAPRSRQAYAWRPCSWGSQASACAARAGASSSVVAPCVTVEVAVTTASEHGHAAVESMSGAADARRGGPGRRRSPRSVLAYPSIPRRCAAVPPRILLRSSSLSPGIAMTWSTGAVFHGNG